MGIFDGYEDKSPEELAKKLGISDLSIVGKASKKTIQTLENIPWTKINSMDDLEEYMIIKDSLSDEEFILIGIDEEWVYMITDGDNENWIRPNDSSSMLKNYIYKDENNSGKFKKNMERTWKKNFSMQDIKKGMIVRNGKHIGHVSSTNSQETKVIYLNNETKYINNIFSKEFEIFSSIGNESKNLPDNTDSISNAKTVNKEIIDMGDFILGMIFEKKSGEKGRIIKIDTVDNMIQIQLEVNNGNQSKTSNKILEYSLMGFFKDFYKTGKISQQCQEKIGDLEPVIPRSHIIDTEPVWSNKFTHSDLQKDMNILLEEKFTIDNIDEESENVKIIGAGNFIYELTFSEIKEGKTDDGARLQTFYKDKYGNKTKNRGWELKKGMIIHKYHLGKIIDIDIETKLVGIKFESDEEKLFSFSVLAKKSYINIGLRELLRSDLSKGMPIKHRIDGTVYIIDEIIKKNGELSVIVTYPNSEMKFKISGADFDREWKGIRLLA